MAAVWILAKLMACPPPSILFFWKIGASNIWEVIVIYFYFQRMQYPEVLLEKNKILEVISSLLMFFKLIFENNVKQRAQ